MNAFAQPPGLPAGMPMPRHGASLLPCLPMAHTCASMGHLPSLLLRTMGPTLPSFAHPHP
jgi:hypothetical protein